MVSMASKKFPTDSYDLLEFTVVFISGVTHFGVRYKKKRNHLLYT